MGAAVRRNPVLDERGAAMVEFALVFPLQLLFTLGVMQLALLYIGHLVVNYAAFQAARAALASDCDTLKTERAAEIACDAVIVKGAGGSGIHALTRLSMLKTGVRIIDKGEHSHEIIVEVDHDFELIIPVVNRAFAFSWESFFWFSEKRLPSAQDAQNKWLETKYGSPHLRITKQAVVVKPWKSPRK